MPSYEEAWLHTWTTALLLYYETRWSLDWTLETGLAASSGAGSKGDDPDRPTEPKSNRTTSFHVYHELLTDWTIEVIYSTKLPFSFKVKFQHFYFKGIFPSTEVLRIQRFRIKSSKLNYCSLPFLTVYRTLPNLYSWLTSHLTSGACYKNTRLVARHEFNFFCQLLVSSDIFLDQSLDATMTSMHDIVTQLETAVFCISIADANIAELTTVKNALHQKSTLLQFPSKSTKLLLAPSQR